MTDQQQPEPEWTPVAPQNPYPGGTRPAGPRAYAIIAMATGLAALLTAVVAGVYDILPTQIGWALGIAAVAVALVALIKRSHPAPASVIGLISGALAIALALYLPTLNLGGGVGAGDPTSSESNNGIVSGEDNASDDNADADNAADGGSSDGSMAADGSDSGSGSDSDEQHTLIDWPANTESGSILFERGESDSAASLAMRESAPLASGAAPVTLEVDRERVADIKLYVDYRCPHCGTFEQTNGDYLTELIEAGDATLELVPLTFMDRFDASRYSSRAAGLVYCLVDAGDADAAWAAHNALLSAGVQPGNEQGPASPQLLELISDATGEVSGAVRGCIESDQFAPFASALNDWVSSNTVPNANNASLRVEGTPLVLVNGEVYTGEADDAAQFKTFFEQNR